MKLGVVYRCYDADGDLLYVGVTTKPVNRIHLHARQTRWWSQVDRMEYDQPLPLESARRSEREQIYKLEPRFNRTKPSPRFSSSSDAQFSHVGRNIRRVRQEQGHTLESLGRAVGVTNRAVGQWEQGKTVPSRPHLERLAVELDRNPAWFYAIHDSERVAA